MFFNGASLFAVVLYALASLGSVSAVPSPIDHPEVIPGPGMPSLASLGVTSKGLYEETTPLGKRDLVPRFDRVCHDNGGGKPPRGDAQACINYLRSLDTQMCGVPGGTSSSVEMCRAGQACVYGVNMGNSPTSSYCRDAAFGGQSIIDNCVDGFGLVAGADAAWGNGNLIITIQRC